MRYVPRVKSQLQGKAVIFQGAACRHHLAEGSAPVADTGTDRRCGPLDRPHRGHSLTPNCNHEETSDPKPRDTLKSSGPGCQLGSGGDAGPRTLDSGKQALKGVVHVWCMVLWVIVSDPC